MSQVWTKFELARLEVYWHAQPKSLIVKELQRFSWSAIRAKAESLGLLRWERAPKTVYKTRRRYWLRGGQIYNSTNDSMLITEFNEFDQPVRYRAAHRYVVERIIGRDLEPHECVLFIDRNKLNCHPSNIYVCPRKVVPKYYAGLLDWPKRSNLEVYR